MLVHTYNPSTQEVEVGGSKVWDQPGLHSETLSQEKTIPRDIFWIRKIHKNKLKIYMMW
jgi:hypothetical protein